MGYKVPQLTHPGPTTRPAGRAGPDRAGGRARRLPRRPAGAGPGAGPPAGKRLADSAGAGFGLLGRGPQLFTLTACPPRVSPPSRRGAPARRGGAHRPRRRASARPSCSASRPSGPRARSTSSTRSSTRPASWAAGGSTGWPRRRRTLMAGLRAVTQRRCSRWPAAPVPRRAAHHRRCWCPIRAAARAPPLWARALPWGVTDAPDDFHAQTLLPCAAGPVLRPGLRRDSPSSTGPTPAAPASIW
jgi:hypothetical protein